MKNFANKCLVCFLSLLMCFALIVPAFAAEETKTDEKAAETEEKTFDYLKEYYPSPEAKLASEELYFENGDYAIYGDEVTGEVGILVKATGQILLTNPYDAATSKSSDAVKQQLLSQIILMYSDNSGNQVPLNSFADAAFASEETKQIHMNATRTGLRVEYTIGREAVKYIVPRQIEKTAFENDILGYFEPGSREYKKLSAYYTLKDPNAPGQSASTIDAMQTKWPITRTYAIYVLDTQVGNREMLELEGYIKNNTYYDEYAKVEEMYELLDYVDTSAAPALFRFAIEYDLDDMGLQIRLPGSSIRYDSSNYTLENVKFLPYFCAGSSENTGFTFVPDGSGTITRFEDIAGKSFTLTGRLYGRDYSFHTISGSNQETMRLPAFGVMETRDVFPAYVPEEETEESEESETSAETEETAPEEESGEETAEPEAAPAEETPAEETEAAEEPEETEESEEEPVEVIETEEEVPQFTAGFVAYLVEGDAMTEITADHGGTVHKYNSVYTTFYPKPSDSYVLEGISSTGSAAFKVQSDRRYTGNYTLRIFPITGDDCDYNDMAGAIRDYLTANGTFEKMKPADEPSDDVPLYLETFGDVKTTKKFAGFPIDVQTPLTSFDDLKEMIDDLQANGVNNINVKITGWYNGGLRHNAPAKLSVENAIGGAKGLKDLAAYASEHGVGIYPDLDFVYVNKISAFDGFNFKRDSVKTIDDRSAAYRKYSPLYQGFEQRGSLIISPTSATNFYHNIRDKFLTFGATGISVGTLGSELSSDHNDDYTLNREDVKTIVSGLLSEMKADNGSVMTSGGNAYTLASVDHILGVSLDSSLNINTSESIPFVGMVLHGNVEFTGPAINLDGDFEYSFLKAMENGADLYFILSKRNTSELKQYENFSKYYAVGYDIWRNANENDIVSTYVKFNEAMKKVKYAYITEHETLSSRVVRVKYDNGTEFLLNYNTHPVEVDGVTIEPLGFAER